jgi:putative colanic acid biosynthesis glycosyltransferase
MKAVLINSWYKQYSTGKLVYEFNKFLLRQGEETQVYYGYGAEINENGVYRIASTKDIHIHKLLATVTGLQGCFSNENTKKVISDIESFAPDVVYLFNLHSYYLDEFMLLTYLKSKNIKVIYMLFDEYPYLGKCCFAGECEKFKTECNHCPKKREYPSSLFFDRSTYLFNKKNEAYTDWDNLTFTGVQFLYNQAQKSKLLKGKKFKIMDMGVDLKNNYYPKDAEGLRNKLGISKESKIVVTVGPYGDERKGIAKFISIAKMMEDKDIVFINIGFNGKNVELPTNFIPVSYVSNIEELSIYYSLADVYAITSSGEAMSLTCMEALGCGTPIVGFDISGTPFSAEGNFGEFVEFDNLREFTDAIDSMPRKNEKSINACRDYALSRYEISDYLMNLYMLGFN